MKVSEVDTKVLAEYLRLDDPEEIEKKEELDKYADITQALFVLVADMFDNRNLQTDNKPVMNPAVRTILNLHSVNLL